MSPAGRLVDLAADIIRVVLTDELGGRHRPWCHGAGRTIRAEPRRHECPHPRVAFHPVLPAFRRWAPPAPGGLPSSSPNTPTTRQPNEPSTTCPTRTFPSSTPPSSAPTCAWWRTCSAG